MRETGENGDRLDCPEGSEATGVDSPACHRFSHSAARAIIGADPPGGQPLGNERKVRSPQGSVPANGRGDSLKADFTESATENIPPRAAQAERGKGEMVR